MMKKSMYMCRWAMLGALGCITPELLAQQGITVSTLWSRIQKADFKDTSLVSEENQVTFETGLAARMVYPL